MYVYMNTYIYIHVHIDMCHTVYLLKILRKIWGNVIASTSCGFARPVIMAMMLLCAQHPLLVIFLFPLSINPGQKEPACLIRMVP